MKKFALPFAVLGATVSLFMHAAPAQAQATRTWVSGVGDDANPCSRTAPCKTFAGAISKTASGGEINCIDPGGFGAVTITKSITIDCNGTFGSILAAGTNGIVINGPAGAVVRIRNISIQGVGTGLNGIRWVGNTGQLYVENVRIMAFTTRGIDFIPTGSAELYVSDTTISEIGGAVATNAAIFIRPTGAASTYVALNRAVLQNSANGLIVDSTATSALVNVLVKESLVAGNNIHGISSTAGAQIFLVVHSSAVSGNVNTGILSSGANSLVQLHQTQVGGNTTGIAVVSSGLITSFRSNMINGNITVNGVPTLSLNPN